MQVGGDGLFSEVLNGMTQVSACTPSDLPQTAQPQPLTRPAQQVWAAGGERSIAAGRLRLGHIPAGSTDAVAFSLHGERSAVTAALHVALGDRCLPAKLGHPSPEPWHASSRASCC